MIKLENLKAALDNCGIPYHFEVVRDKDLRLHASVPGRRWEIEFSGDTMVGVEVFRSESGPLRGEAAEDTLERLFSEHGDCP